MIDTKLFTRFALTCVAAFALCATTTMTSCSDDGGEEPAVPVVSITTQPTAPAGLVEGSITGSLTVVATVTEGATLTYQWYSNTTASNEGGTTISGATTASYTLPTDLTEGTYYYFCEVGAEGAESKRTNAVTVTVTAEPVPVITITTQPTAPAELTEGSITGSLTVEATVTEVGGATLTYQWYSNTTASNEGGTAIDGATTASFTLPTTLTAGTYYYFCEVGAEEATAVRSNAVTVTVNAVPVISITTQPTAPAELTEGEIPANTALTVEATVTEGATLTYQWYSNTTASNTGGTAIDGATTASFTLPTTLTAGTHYYFCEVGAEKATAVRSNAVTVTVVAPVPVLNGRVTWKDGKYALTTDPTDAGLLFKFGSVVGIFTGNGAVLTLPSTASDSFDTGDIAWSPIGAPASWWDVPAYNDYPANLDAAYQTAANVKAGKGDPCRLIGLDLNKIATTDAGSLTTADIDNGKWRMPTSAEFQSFLGVSPSNYWTTLNGVNGGMFPNKTEGSEGTFLPAAGYRAATGAFSSANITGGYWPATPMNATMAYYIYFFSGGIYSSYMTAFNNGYAVRCVRQ